MSSHPAKPSSTDHDNLRILRRRPLCIICAKSSEAETLAHFLDAKSYSIPGSQVAGVNDSHMFWLGQCRLKSGDLKFYITSSLRQGVQSFAIHTSLLFSALRPVFAIHAGVCAAMEGAGIEIGDVVFGDAAVNYEEGKWTTEDGKLIFLPDYDQINEPSGDMQGYISKSRESKHKDWYGVFVTGSAVREDAAGILSKIHGEVTRNAIALEMEASVFLKLCRHSGVKSLGVIKGVSDMGNPDKTKIPGAYKKALANTADSITPWLVYSDPDVDDREHGPERGEELAKVYYENFLMPLLDLVFDDAITGMTTVKKGTDGEPMKVDTPIRFKVVIPESCAVEKGVKAQLVKRCDLSPVLQIKDTPGYKIWYKNGTLVDIPSTLNSLRSDPDSRRQADLFQLHLKDASYFSETLGLAQIVSWKKFLEDEQDG